jgi:hypothetical protein
VRQLLIGILILWLSAPAFGAVVTQIYGTNTTLVSVNTDVSNGAGVIGSEVTWTNTGYLRAECEFRYVDASGSPSTGSGMAVWFLIKIDGTNYEDGSATIFPSRLPDIYFPLRTGVGSQRVVMKDIGIPPGPITTVVRNDSGQTIQGSVNVWTVKCRPRTFAVN